MISSKTENARSETDASCPDRSPRSPIWLWPNLLSLDAPLVAVIWQWLFAVTMRIKLPGEIYVILGLTVWIIYVADRLMDGVRLKKASTITPRHRFYRENALVFLPLLLIGLGVDVWLVVHHVPVGMLRMGVLMSFFVIAYFMFRFVLSRRPQSGAPREILCGFIFAIGTVVSVYFYGGDVNEALFRTFHPALLAILFSANCVAIAYWEAKVDLANGDGSLANTVPASGRDLPVWLGILVVATGVLLAMGYPGDAWGIYLAILLSALGLLGLKLNDHRLSANALRVLADAVLLTPLIIVPLVKQWMSAR